MSRTLLAQRLKELEDAGVIERRPSPRGRGWEYHPTPAGEEFRPVIERLGEWGQRWARRQVDRETDLDPGLLMWDIHRRLNDDRLPNERVVVRFDFRGIPQTSRCRQRTWWLVVKQPEVDLCLKDPGFETDLVVEADLSALTKVWVGDIRLAEAVRAGLVTLHGRRGLVAAFPTWLRLSALAGVERPPLVAAR